MRPQKQPNSWSCLPTAAAIVIDMDVADFINQIGHDGSEVRWPGTRRPQRSFHLQEIIDVLHSQGYSATVFETNPQLGSYYESDTRSIFSFEQKRKRLNRLLLGFQGILIGFDGSTPHACAFNNGVVYDTDGTIHWLKESFVIGLLVSIRKVK